RETYHPVEAVGRDERISSTSQDICLEDKA
ncbi:hypothetical protein TGMAS_304900B, partial [Toxoplasma gondii MAS]